MVLIEQSVIEKMARAVLAEPRRPGDKHGGLWEDPTDRDYAERVSQASLAVARPIIEMQERERVVRRVHELIDATLLNLGLFPTVKLLDTPRGPLGDYDTHRGLRHARPLLHKIIDDKIIDDNIDLTAEDE